MIADAVKLVNPGSYYKPADQVDTWHQYPVTDTVQQWLDGTYSNYGFEVQAHDESDAGLTGEMVYDSGDGAFGGESEFLPKLTVSWGRPGVALNTPTVIHATGAELHWPAYSPPAGDTGAGIAEYQLYRSTKQSFTPSSATFVASIDKDKTSYTDTTASPTPSTSTDETGQKYYYMLAVKTADGEVIPSTTKLVEVPKAGHTVQVIQGSGKVTDTTLDSGQPSTNLDTMPGIEHAKGSTIVGNNANVQRMLARFDTSSVPKTADVVSAQLQVDSAITNATNADGSTCCDTTGPSGSQYEIAPLSQGFDETTATWKNASSSTAWKTAGGDYGAVESSIDCCGDHRGRHTWDATKMATGWVADPGKNYGLEMRVKSEAASQERTVFLSAETSDQALSPRLEVVYADRLEGDTYYSPQTPARVSPGSTYTVPVTVTNTTASTWAAGTRELGYHWTTRDGGDVPGGDAAQLFTDLPELAPGASTTVDAQIKAPQTLNVGNARAEYNIGWDVHKSDATDASKAWLSQDPGIEPLVQPVAVEDPTSDELGLESFFAYQTNATGAGTSLSTNLANGNAVWQDNLWSNPNRDLAAFARIAYNSKDGFDSGFGPGWSTQLTGPIRTGDHLQAWPLTGMATEVRLPDGDGTTHVFTRNTDDGTWKSPPGVNYQLTVADETNTTEPDGDAPGVLAPLGCLNLLDPPDDYYTLTRPDGTEFDFDCGGYLTKSISKNGNELDYHYSQYLSLNLTKRFLTSITVPDTQTPVDSSTQTEAHDREVAHVDYNTLNSSYDYIDANGDIAHGTVLSDVAALDKVSAITDPGDPSTTADDRVTKFLYDQSGYLRRIIDGAGTDQAKTYTFGYDDTDNNLLTPQQLTSITDPRGNTDGATASAHTSHIAYYSPTTDGDPAADWGKVKTFTDRGGNATGFTYDKHSESNSDSDSDGDSGSSDDAGDLIPPEDPATDATVTDAKNNPTTYVLDGYGRPLQLTNALKQTTTLAWDGDNNVTYLREPNGAERSYCYDQQSGYPIWERDAVQNKDRGGAPNAGEDCDPNNSPADNAAAAPDGAAVYEYQARDTNGYTLDLFRTTSPQGRQSQFSYDSKGNLLTVTDGKGLTTEAGDDYTTSYTYDSYGQLSTATDANGNVTKFSDYGPTGYPKTTQDAAGNTSTTLYDARGQVTEADDPGKGITKQSYDIFGRPLEGSQRLKTDEDGTEHWITTPAPTYDANDNITRTVAANGGVSTATYDADDQVTESTTPNDDAGSTDPGPATRYAYDAVGNLISTTEPKGVAASNDTDNTGDSSNDGSGSSDGGADFTTSYVYDAVGQQISVTNAHGDQIKYSYDSVGNQIEVDDPTKTASDDTSDYTTKTSYDADHQPVKVTDADGNTTSTAYDCDGLAVSTTNATGHTSYTRYDARGLPTQTYTPWTGPGGNNGEADQYRVTKYAYDQVGNKTWTLTPRTTDPDSSGLAAPAHDDTDATAAEVCTDDSDDPDDPDPGTTTTGTDGQGGSDLGLQACGTQDDGSAPAGGYHAYASCTRYDELNRQIRQYQPYNQADSRYNDPNVYTETSYDAAGHVTKTSLPPSAGQSKRNTTSVSYFDNGWIASSTDPWGIKTAYTYDDLGNQTARTLTGADGASRRNMSWSYYPDGKLASRSDGGVPVGDQSVTVDNNNQGVATATGTWATATSDDGQQGEDYRTHTAAADGSDAAGDRFTWTLDVPADGTYNLAATWPSIDGAATDAKYTLTTGSGDSKQTQSYTVDQTSNAGAWSDLDHVELTQGETVTVTLAPSATGTVAADAVRLVRDNSTGTSDASTGKSFDYDYDANGNLTSIAAKTHGDAAGTYAIAYDGLDQVNQVTENLPGQDPVTTSYAYNNLGQPTKVSHDQPEQVSTYTYTGARNLLSKVAVDEDTTDDDPGKVTNYTYDALGRVAQETKGNKNTLTYAYQADGAVKTQREETSSGALVASHDYTYDANGNQTQDVAVKQNADDTGGDPLDTTTTYTYDPLDRLATKDKTGHASSSESYVHDDNANVVSQVIDTDSTDVTPGDETDFTYDRNRLTASTVNPGAAGQDDQTASYRYDAYGRQTSVVGDTADADPKTISRTVYDGFDHVKSSEKLPEDATATSDLTATDYTYDPLDRRSSQTTHAGTDAAKTTDYAYLGLSSQVLGEKVGGQLTKSYQYSPWGQRLSQVSEQGDDAKGVKAGDTAYYGYNAHTDVETVTGGNGDTVATYGYTAYGQQDKAETTGIDKPDNDCNDDTANSSGSSSGGLLGGILSGSDSCDPGDSGNTSGEEDEYNAFRYNATRWDPATETYDMGFRDYDPQLNTFTTRDNYNGALDDLALGTDPYTGNRYAFGSGNPISNVELDGHMYEPSQYGCDEGAGRGDNAQSDAAVAQADKATASNGGGSVQASAEPTYCDGPHGPVLCAGGATAAETAEVGKGFVVDGLWGMVKDTGSLVGTRAQCMVISDFMCMRNDAGLAINIARDPKAAGSAAWDAATGDMRANWRNGHQARASGEAIFDITAAIIGTKGADNIGKGSIAARTVRNVADTAAAGGKSRGAASVFQPPDGGALIKDVSGSDRVFHPKMQEALDAVPEEIRPGWHGWCSEIGCMNQSLQQGRGLEGGRMWTVAIGDSEPGHGLLKDACPTCAFVMPRFGVTPQ